MNLILECKEYTKIYLSNKQKTNYNQRNTTGTTTHLTVVSAGDRLWHTLRTEVADRTETGGWFFVDGALWAVVALPTQPGGCGQTVSLTVLSPRAGATVGDILEVSGIWVGTCNRNLRYIEEAFTHTIL